VPVWFRLVLSGLNSAHKTLSNTDKTRQNQTTLAGETSMDARGSETPVPAAAHAELSAYLRMSGSTLTTTEAIVRALQRRRDDFMLDDCNAD
jgi:hypothetical protein